MGRILVAAMISLLAPATIGRAGDTADDVSEFGIIIGKPINVSICPRAGSPEAICVEKIGPTDFSLRFPDSDRPSWVRQVFISTREGLVEKFLIDTSPDPAQQEAIVEALNGKYGKPQQLRTLQKYNRFGAIMSLEATWKVQGIYIFFTGAESMLAGTLAIKSEKEEALEEEERAARAGK
jgi:hypothetical protein